MEVRLSETGSVTEQAVPVAPDAAWRVLPQVYDTLGLGGGVLDAKGRSYGNSRITARTISGSRTDTFFRCANQGAGPSSINRLRIRFSISTTVSSADEGRAHLRTSIVATGTPREGTSSGRVVCISKGLLEGAIEREVTARVAAGG